MRNKIKLIKLKITIKDTLKFRKIGKEFKEKMRGMTNWYKIIPKQILGQRLRTMKF